MDADGFTVVSKKKAARRRSAKPPADYINTSEENVEDCLRWRKHCFLMLVFCLGSCSPFCCLFSVPFSLLYCLSVWLSVCVCLPYCLSVCVCMPYCLSLHQSVSQSDSIPIYLPVYLSVFNFNNIISIFCDLMAHNAITHTTVSLS